MAVCRRCDGALQGGRWLPRFFLCDVNGRLYILQARPETVKSQESKDKVEKFALKSYGKVLASGRAIGQKIGVGPVRVVNDPAEMNSVKPGDVLVASFRPIR